MNCTDCGGLFEPIKGSARPRIRCFGCSPSQAKGLPRKTRKETTWLNMRHSTCARCSKPFTAKLPRERFCSGPCRNAFHNRARQEAARDRAPRPCAWCAQPFAPEYGDTRRRFCGTECIRRHHAARTSGKAHVRRARRFGGAIEPVDRLKVFARDGWMCRACCNPTPRELMGTAAGGAPELDHIVPLAAGGDHSRANTQLLCRRCNQLKADRPMGELLQRLAA